MHGSNVDDVTGMRETESSSTDTVSDSKHVKAR